MLRANMKPTQFTALYTMLLFLSVKFALVPAVELTFELPDNAKQCFHEDMQQGVKASIDFQVVTGGQYDVDATLESASGQVLYKGIKKQSDVYTFTAAETGTYKLCFSNEFSTFSHKLVYLDFEVGEEKPLPGIGAHSTAMTKLESATSNLHEQLNTIGEYQTHHRLMEAQSRKRAEDLNSIVLLHSMVEALIILFIGLGQVTILRSFFNDKK